MVAALQQMTGTERIRGPNLRSFKRFTEALPMAEALRSAADSGLILASSKRLSKAFESKEWLAIAYALPCWSGTMVAYVEPGKTFMEGAEKIHSLDGKHYVIHVDPGTRKRYLFPVPEEHLDKKDAILVAEHPYHSLERSGDDFIVCALQLDVIEDFPASRGWYPGDPIHGIPHGNQTTESDPNAVLSWRIARKVGLISRGGVDSNADNRRVILFDTLPSATFGAVVEAAESR